jgi:hypothetical protein
MTLFVLFADDIKVLCSPVGYGKHSTLIAVAVSLFLFDHCLVLDST